MSPIYILWSNNFYVTNKFVHTQNSAAKEISV